MSETLCQDCGELFPYDGDAVDLCIECVRARVQRYFGKVVA